MILTVYNEGTFEIKLSNLKFKNTFNFQYLLDCMVYNDKKYL
jgi:hypothetical protein